MAIDVKTPNSPGWWILKGTRKLQARLPRLEKLDSYHRGDPPLPVDASATTRTVFRDFQKRACTNLAELIVGSVRERVSVRDIRTAASGDKVDSLAYAIWKDNGLDVEFGDVLENALSMGDAYMIVGLDPEDDQRLVITGEDPRQVVTFHNPARQSEVRAAVKVFHDPDESRDYVYLFLPGGVDEAGVELNARRYVAYRDRKSPGAGVSFSANSFAWDGDSGGADGEELSHKLVPVLRLRNRRGVGEFEPHLTVLDRINHEVYNRMVISMYQAFKQRAIQVDEDDAVDEKGAPLEAIPDDVLTSDPGSWIQLPYNSKVWESQQADMQGILSATKDDIRLLAAVTRRPMSLFQPDNESAAGAQAMSEGLRFATEDKQTRSTQFLVDVFYVGFLALGDEERADRSKITIAFKPAERFSIADKASASAQASTVLAKRTIMREIWQMSPDELERAESELADELLLAGELTGGGDNT